ncbi:hypothetical protein [Alcaligenes endophyticus]|uniref:Uncharacterized protein n=1 Tax=Alcaligenes endophyticus TaxID=1929088 RepID=A0ABT8ENE6_9BURK|nr:hypothetical protein [Alcaligenes endophyticus]MCX5592800.1 hypothetical protein [Alcaligenes endophyticus]MDN4122842.1 hypothetical protein [Alcaligenes endophyticus]
MREQLNRIEAKLDVLLNALAEDVDVEPSVSVDLDGNEISVSEHDPYQTLD